MLTLNEYLTEYQKSHLHPTNVRIHTICVPLIFLSILGLLFAIPFKLGPLRVADVVSIAVMAYYLVLSRKYFVIMLIQFAVCYGICIALEPTGYLFSISLGIFIITWIFQFYGHKVEGKKPSFFQDLLFLLIGPIWVVKKIFKLQD